MSTYTTSNGAPVSEPYAAQRAGVNGPLLLQGMHFDPVPDMNADKCRKTSTTLISSLTLIASVSLSVL